jgi:hypothetical protein
MIWNMCCRLGIVWLVLFLASTSLFAQHATDTVAKPLKPKMLFRRNLDGIPRYFYHGSEYGSESLYNPVTLVLNMGYDITQLKSAGGGVFNFPFPRSAKNTFINLVRPDKAIRDIGAGKWISSELVPGNFTRKGSQWLPNYTLHLFGSGMTYTNISEWYDAHGVRRPRLMGLITVVTGQLMNEIIENEGWVGTNTDPIADFYIFNIASILLFTSPKVNHFFSHTLHMADWSLMPTFTLPYGNIQNNGQYFSLKYSMPFYKPLKLFMRMGMSTQLGLSYQLNKEYCLSVGAGVRSYELQFLDSAARQVTVSTVPTAGIFLDKNNTVLAQLIWSQSEDNFFNASVYPGVLHIGKFTPGLWAIIGRHGYATFGITSKYSFGIGIGGEVNGPF